MLRVLSHGEQSQIIHHANDQAEAVTTLALQPRLMMERRANPGTGGANDLFLYGFYNYAIGLLIMLAITTPMEYHNHDRPD